MIGQNDPMAPRPAASELAAIAQILAADTSGCDGDDAAIVAVPGGLACITVDVAVVGVHLAPELTPWQMGYRAAACALSDLAAMAAQPLHVVCGIVVPPSAANGDTGIDSPRLREWRHVPDIVDGVRARARSCGADVVGGDVVGGGELSIAVTCIGTGAEIGRDGLIGRRGARSGDVICVTGSLGAALVGLARLRTGNRAQPNQYVDPPNRIRAGRVCSHYATSMIDVSDGVATDVRHIASASRIGIEIDLDRLPRAEGTDVDTAACFGDDYELLCTVPRDQFEPLRRALASMDEPVALTDIGVCGEPGAGVRLSRDDSPVDLHGFEHR